MAQVEELKLASELKQEPPKFVPSTEGLPPAMDDNAVRAIFAKADAEGISDLGAFVETPGPIGQPAKTEAPPPPVQTQVPAQTPAVEVPPKFQKPDGTVDEEKLKASTARLDEAIQGKTKTVDELLSDYKAKEKEYHEKSRQAKDLRNVQANVMPMAPPIPEPQPQNVDQIRQQLLQLQQNDPIAFAVEIARAVAQKEARDIAEPALQVTRGIAEQQHDQALRNNITAIAQSDPRILTPEIYAEFQKELHNPDENYYSLKNPFRAAWNEVKERMRLGETPKASAPPSTSQSPTLGRGSPTPVQGLSTPQTPASLYQQVTGVDPYSDDGKRLEAALREASQQVWRT